MSGNYSSPSDTSDDDEQPLKRRRTTTTDEYLYETLFKQQVDSDITVVILDKKWQLHKVIIKQCPYFAGMFNARRRGPKKKVIHIQIDDENITNESVELALGSLYKGIFNLTAENVVSTLATASLFQLQLLADACIKFMKETIEKDTVADYCNASITYAVPEIKAAAVGWLELNIVYCSECRDFMFLKNISAELMYNLISSPNLIVNGSEFYIYKTLRKWLYLQLIDPEASDRKLIDEFYSNRTWQTPLLLTERGKDYILPFQALKIKHLLTRRTDNILMIEEDKILPDDWIQLGYKDLWRYSLEIMRKEDTGPTADVSKETFERECMTTAHYIKEYKTSTYFWSECSLFDLDFEIIFSKDGLKVGRYKRERKGCINLDSSPRKILLKVSLIELDNKNYVKRVRSSKLLRFSLDLKREERVMDYDRSIKYPLWMMVKILSVNPRQLSGQS